MSPGGVPNIIGSDATAHPTVGVDDCGVDGATTSTPPFIADLEAEIDGYLALWYAYSAAPLPDDLISLTAAGDALFSAPSFHDPLNSSEAQHNHG